MSIVDLAIRSLTEGGPYAISLAGWLAWFYERRQNKEHQDKMFELAQAQIEATIKHEAAIENNTRLAERLFSRSP